MSVRPADIGTGKTVCGLVNRVSLSLKGHQIFNPVVILKREQKVLNLIPHNTTLVCPWSATALHWASQQTARYKIPGAEAKTTSNTNSFRNHQSERHFLTVDMVLYHIS